MTDFLANFRALPPQEALEFLLDATEERLPREARPELEMALEALPEDRRRALVESRGGWAALAQELVGDPAFENHPMGVDLLLDTLAGLRIRQVESSLPDASGRERGATRSTELGRASWSGSGVLSRSALNTPYLELFEILEKLSPGPGHKIVDLGSSFGRLGLVIGMFFEECSFTGYEVVHERADEGDRVARLHGLWPRVRNLSQDLAAKDFAPEEADIYYLYDPVNRDTLAKVLSDLARIAQRRPIRLVSRGKTGGLQETLARCSWLRREGFISTRHSPIWIHRGAGH